MTSRGGRENRPQGEGAQATEVKELRGMRNAGRRNGTCCPPRARQEGPAVRGAVPEDVKQEPVLAGLRQHLLKPGCDDDGCLRCDSRRYVRGEDRSDHYGAYRSAVPV